MKELLNALFSVQQEVSCVTKNATNPHFKSRYADYINIQETIFPILHKHGILVLQPTICKDGKNIVCTRLYNVATGAFLEAETEIVFTPGNAQAQGSGITYARRYGLMSLLALGADDDDANKATGLPDKAQPKAQTKVQMPELNSFEKSMAEFDAEVDKAIRQVERCASIDELVNVWKMYRNLQNVERFVQAKNNKKQALA